MAKLSTAAMTMFMCLALQVACLRQTCHINSVTKQAIDASSLNPAARDDEDSVTKQATNANSLNPAARDDEDKEGRVADRRSDEEDKACGEKNQLCNCFGKMCIGSQETFEKMMQSPHICEDKVQITRCSSKSMTMCSEANDEIGKICSDLETHENTRCWCDPQGFNDEFPEKYVFVPWFRPAAGASGVVLRANVIGGGDDEPKVVAVKYIASEKRNLNIAQEVDLQKAAWAMPLTNQWRRRVGEPVRNTGVPRVYDSFEIEGNLFIITEFAEGVELIKFVPELKKDMDVYFIAWKLAKIIESLHGEHIVHRDIKLENLKFSVFRKKLMLLDFGLATHLWNNQYLNETVGTRKYAAPEVLYKRKYDFKADIWSMGVVFFAMVFKVFPFDGILGDSLNWENVRKQAEGLGLFTHFKKESLDEDSLDEFIDLLSHMLVNDPEERYSIDKVLGSAWMGSMAKKLKRAEEELENAEVLENASGAK